jgi:hypothetical protein
MYLRLKYLNKVLPRGVGFPNICFDNLLCGCSCYYSANGYWIKCVFFQSSHLDLKFTMSAYEFMLFCFTWYQS